MSSTPEKIWFNGQLIPYANATVHVLSHAIHYGSSVFEGVRAYKTPAGTAIFRLEEHTQRLFASASIYRMKVPYTPQIINQATRDTVRENKLAAAYIRPLVMRGNSGIGVCPPEDGPIDVMIAAFDFGAYLGKTALEEGIDACISSWNRAAPNTFPTAAKAGGNYLNSQLIAMEARRNGYGEGIALAPDGTLSEGSAENLFIVKKGKLYTPPATASILVGITRDTIFTLAADLGLEVIEQSLLRESLYLADEAFFCGTGVEITPIKSVDRSPIGNGKRGPITKQLQDRFFGLFDGSTPDRHGWLDPIA